MASPIATWLANAGCEHDGLTDVLIACGGGDSLEQLKAVKAAERNERKRRMIEVDRRSTPSTVVRERQRGVKRELGELDA